MNGYRARLNYLRFALIVIPLIGTHRVRTIVLMANCIHSDSCPVAAPLWVGHNNKRFPFAQSGYIPSFCAYCPDYIESKEPDKPINLRPQLRELELTVKTLVRRSHIHGERKSQTQSSKVIKGAE